MENELLYTKVDQLEVGDLPARPGTTEVGNHRAT